MWHQFSLHALTYCRLCKDVERRNSSRLCYQSFDCFMVGRSRRCAWTYMWVRYLGYAARDMLRGAAPAYDTGAPIALWFAPRVPGSKKRAGRPTQARVLVRPSVLIIRSYQGESTGSHPNSEVKHPWACSVLRWGTTWESQVTYVFEPFGAGSPAIAHVLHPGA